MFDLLTQTQTNHVFVKKKKKQVVGPNQLVVDLSDPNRPRFTMQELKEVLQERNQLKAQLMVAQEELQLFKRCFM